MLARIFFLSPSPRVPWPPCRRVPWAFDHHVVGSTGHGWPVPSGMRIATWNTKWAGPTHGPTIAGDLVATKADVIVGTEVLVNLLPSYEHVVDAGTGWGYELPDGRRRKVAMWSANPWTDVTTFDDPAAPGGRLIAATTETDVGPIRVVGVCIPWRDANVATGRRDRESWEDHLAFLSALPSMTSTSGSLKGASPVASSTH